MERKGERDGDGDSKKNLWSSLLKNVSGGKRLSEKVLVVFGKGLYIV